MTHPSTPTYAYWEHFGHMADIGVRGFGPTLAEAFTQAALALTAVVCDPATVRPLESVTLRCEAADPEFLFVDWLNAIVYEMATRQMVFGRFDLNIDDGVLTATLWGEQLDRERHQPAVEIKGATFTELAVTRQPDGLWRAQCVVDV
jgi:tRNA nucleotidyltransferase (CCA-adding enzyme)